MQKNFLFDSNDRRQYGKGVDRMGNKDDGLSLNWKSEHAQTSFAKIGKYTLEVVYWHTRYEARVNYRAETMECDNFEYKSRLAAQIGAENLFKKLIYDGNELLVNFNNF